ncbi:WD40 repeat domain-containing protein [Endozoicomonas numazuensis]|uniref:WD40 repeat domain-containing protein n=1 Tax=Endozoicomonas numazuensis TaxID=1137799 RepID=UPI001377A3A3|nr:WD40 repeat domain-containing protein [Endozoicomonas numazuensis]
MLKRSRALTMISKLAGLMLGVLASISHGITEGSGEPEDVKFIPGPAIKFDSTELMELDEEGRTYGSQTWVTALRFKPDGSELVMTGSTVLGIPQTFVQRFNTCALTPTQKNIHRLRHQHLIQGVLQKASICSGGGCVVLGITFGSFLYSFLASTDEGNLMEQYLLNFADSTRNSAHTFILDDTWLAYGRGGQLSLVNPANQTVGIPLPGAFPSDVLALDSQGPWLASGDEGGDIRVHNLTNLSDISYVEMQAHSDIVRSLSFSPDGARLLSGGRDNLARLWHREAEGHFTLIQNMAFDADVDVVLYHPGGEHFVVAEGPRVHLYDAADQTRLDTLTMANNMSEVFSLAFHPNGTWLAVGNNRDDLELYSLEGFPELLTCSKQPTLQPTVQPTSTATMPSPAFTSLMIPASSFTEHQVVVSATVIPPFITTDENMETGGDLGTILGAALSSGVIIATLSTTFVVIYLKLIKPKRVVEKA